MNLNQIAKELEQKADQRDKKGILQTLKELPNFYPSLIQHSNLQFLKDECSKLEIKVKDWKWPSLTDKFFDKESLVKWSEGKPVPKYRTIIDDIYAFADLLRSFAKEDKEKPEHLITLTVAVKNFNVGRATLNRAIKDGRLTSYTQAENAPKNAARLIDAVEVASLWPKRN